ncbi:type III secretion system inner rod subunit SctI [Yersinia enterocolitica]|uniref:type III secretion system inner rod subunit SctI n=1 Tax=Yersinia enterocolitica TaxID=630 RepID=UPI00398C840D
MQVNSIQSVQKIIESYQNASELNNEVLPLDDRIIQSFAKTAVQTENTKNTALQNIQNPQQGLSPEKLIESQEVLANYNIEVSLISTIARKSVGAVETLLRA